jgi:hypothetical protein
MWLLEEQGAQIDKPRNLLCSMKRSYNKEAFKDREGRRGKSGV